MIQIQFDEWAMFGELDELNRKNDKFFIMLKFFEDAVHDLKTPVSIILSNLQLLESEDLSPQVQERISKIRQYCNKVLKQIRDTTDFSKICNGQFAPRYVNYNFVFLAESITHSIIPLAERNNIEIIFDTNTEEKIMAIDKDMFERILLNLLSNAIKFTPRGGVVNVDLTVSDDRVSIDVIDSGCGISDERLEAIFERYETTNATSDSVGVGLDIVRELISVLNGTITPARRPDGNGTIMHVEFPAFINDADILNDSDFSEYLSENVLQMGLTDNLVQKGM